MRIMVLLCLTASVLTFGCAHFGRIVSPEYRVPLVSGQMQQGVFTQSGHTLAYSYILQGRMLTIEGLLDGRGYKTMAVRMVFVDSRGEVLGEGTVFHSGYRTYSTYGQNRSFAKTVEIPPDTTDFTFDMYAEYRTTRND